MKIKIILVLGIAILANASCNKGRNFNYPTGIVGISKIVYFPELQLAGDNVVSVVMGTTYTDSGATATINGQSVTTTTSGTVNTSQVGLYFLTYSASNPQGYSATAQRLVVVIPSAETPGVDLSGIYASSGETNVTINKLAPGVYYTPNCWGDGSAAIIPAYFICTDGTSVSIPLQNGPAGHIETASPGTYAGGLITWTITRLDFAGGPLTLTKHWQKQ
jgi:hypothetical protein